ncbi:MAG: pilin [Xanthomonadaceae bacterium]|nr:pilin [Xanthomonadaceae bacterium]
MRSNLQKGFTLIELMIVVAIIGILAMFALPAYQDYTKRTHVAEGIQLAASAKSAVTEYFASNGKWPAKIGTEANANKQAGIAEPSDITGNAVKSITVLDAPTTSAGKVGTIKDPIQGNDIEIEYNTKVEDGAIVVLRAWDTGGAVRWSCDGKTTSSTTGGTTTTHKLQTKHLPSSCRDLSKPTAS